jgi:hypothetical protein
MVTVTDQGWSHERKKTVWLISRQHPMESPPTFLLQGLLERVLDQSEFSYRWRRDIVLKVVPIVNVDGTAEGYSRHNVNGINLNRDWQENIQAEHPEVRAIHQAIDEYVTSGNDIHFFMDLHAAMANYDFGYRMSLPYTYGGYYQNQETFLYLLESSDSWQDRTRWRDLDTSYAFGVSAVTLFDMYNLDTYSSENPLTRREDYSFITIESLHDQGAAWAEAIYSYLYPLNVYDSSHVMLDSILPGEPFIPRVWDFDQRAADSLIVSAVCGQTSDSELVVLYPESDDGLFSPTGIVSTIDSSGIPGDGIVSIQTGAELKVTYVDPLITSRTCDRILPVRHSYVHGDANGDGEVDPGDVVYLLNYLFRSGYPPNPFEAGDTNNDGSMGPGDIVYLINYLYRDGPPPGS